MFQSRLFARHHARHASKARRAGKAAPIDQMTLYCYQDYLLINLKYGIIFNVKVRDVIKMIEEDGWYLSRTRGSHRQYKHSIKSGLITIAGKPNHDLAKGTLNSILKKAGLKQ